MSKETECSVCNKPVDLYHVLLTGEPLCKACYVKSKKASLVLAIAFDATAPYCFCSEFTEEEREKIFEVIRILSRLIDCESYSGSPDDESLYAAIENYIES